MWCCHALDDFTQDARPSNRIRKDARWHILGRLQLVRLLSLAVLAEGVLAAAAAAAAAEEPQQIIVEFDFPRDPPTLTFTRDERFPSVEDRVKIYLSNWYLPSCSSSSKNGKVRYHYLSNATWPTVWIQEPTNVEGQGGSTNGTTTTDLLLLPPPPRQYIVESAIEPDRAFYLDRDTLLACSNPNHNNQSPSNIPSKALYQDRIQQYRNMRLYCPDVADTLLTALDHVVTWTSWPSSSSSTLKDDNNISPPPPPPPPPILLQFGDMRYSHVYQYVNVPLIKKFRSAITSDELRRSTTPTTATPDNHDANDAETAATTATATATDCVVHRRLMETAHQHDSLQPIVWKLSTERHFGMLHRIAREDTPWDNKTNMAVFLGQLTGSSDGYNKDLTDEQNCLNLKRCRLVYRHANSSLVYARLTSTRNRLPLVLNGVPLVTPKVPIGALLQFKAIIMLEGNDVASGLKWALLSQSVVMMPPPKHTSWALEEFLEPWVHYIPLLDDLSDVEAKMSWVLDHDEYARRIAERGSQWMQDLVFHPQAMEDDRLIQEEMLRRYVAHFEPLEELDIPKNAFTTDLK